MKVFASALLLGMMSSAALATEQITSAGPATEQQPARTEPFTLTQAQMDELTAGVCIGNCPGAGGDQVGVNACVIVRNCGPRNNNN